MARISEETHLGPDSGNKALGSCRPGIAALSDRFSVRNAGGGVSGSSTGRPCPIPAAGAPRLEQKVCSQLTLNANVTESVSTFLCRCSDYQGLHVAFPSASSTALNRVRRLFAPLLKIRTHPQATSPSESLVSKDPSIVLVLRF